MSIYHSVEFPWVLLRIQVGWFVMRLQWIISFVMTRTNPSISLWHIVNIQIYRNSSTSHSIFEPIRAFNAMINGIVYAGFPMMRTETINNDVRFDGNYCYSRSKTETIIHCSSFHWFFLGKRTRNQLRVICMNKWNHSNTFVLGLHHFGCDCCEFCISWKLDGVCVNCGVEIEIHLFLQFREMAISNDWNWKLQRKRHHNAQELTNQIENMKRHLVKCGKQITIRM